MKVLVVSLVLLVTLSACAHKKKNCADKESCNKPKTAEVQNIEAVKAAFDGHCPMGLCLKKKVKGDNQYKVDYKGQVYLFSSAEARDKFLSKIDSNIKKANQEWAKFSADKLR